MLQLSVCVIFWILKVIHLYLMYSSTGRSSLRSGLKMKSLILIHVGKIHNSRNLSKSVLIAIELAIYTEIDSSYRKAVVKCSEGCPPGDMNHLQNNHL